MPDTVLYTAEAVSTGDGRNGHVTSSDQRIDLDLAFPPEMGAPARAAIPSSCSRRVTPPVFTARCGWWRGASTLLSAIPR